jgi:hypothetical protein
MATYQMHRRHTRRGMEDKRQDIRGDRGIEGDEGESDGEARRSKEIPRLESSGDTGNGGRTQVRLVGELLSRPY